MPESAASPSTADRSSSPLRRVELASDSAIVFFGVWTIVHQVVYFSGVTFAQTWSLAWLGSAIGVAVYLYHASRRGTLQGYEPRVGWALLLSVVIAVAATLCLSRPDPDDEAYLGYSMVALELQSMPMTSMPASVSMPNGYMVTSYEFLRASLSWATGLPLLTSYYFVWPAIVAGLMVVFQWRLFRILGIRNHAVALLTLIVVMLAWGDSHRAPPNFGFVRLFQGKAALISLVIPVMLYYWANFVERKDRRSFSLLFLGAAAGIGYSPSGIPLGALLIGLFLVATVAQSPTRPDVRSIAGLIGVFAYIVLISLVIRYHFNHEGLGVHAVEGIRPVTHVTYTIEMIEFALGRSVRAGIALLCAVALPLTLRASGNRRMFATYSILCTCLLLFPWSSQWLAMLSYATMSWRWLYAVPFILGIVAAVDRLDDLHSGVALRIGFVATALLIFVLVDPRWVVSPSNGTKISAPAYKLSNPAGITIRPYHAWARTDGPWIVSPVSGTRY